MTHSPTRIAFTALIGLTLITVSGLSQVLRPRPRARVVPPPEVASQAPPRALASERIEFSVHGDVRQQCEGYALPPEPYSMSVSAGDRNLAALEGLARCITDGPLSGMAIELLGASALAGNVDAPEEGAGPADTVRSTLVELGVPTTTLRTHDLGDMSGSDHAAARVVLGVAASGDGQEVP